MFLIFDWKNNEKSFSFRRPPVDWLIGKKEKDFSRRLKIFKNPKRIEFCVFQGVFHGGNWSSIVFQPKIFFFLVGLVDCWLIKKEKRFRLIFSIENLQKNLFFLRKKYFRSIDWKSWRFNMNHTVDPRTLSLECLNCTLCDSRYAAKQAGLLDGPHQHWLFS